MSPDLARHWSAIRALYRHADSVVIASVNDDGSPHMTPIGSLVLRPDGTGYYIEAFTSRLPRNVERDDRISIFITDARRSTFFGGLVRGRFRRPLAVRLTGRAGARRRLTAPEVAGFRRAVRLLRWTRGYRLLWGDLRHAREIIFDDFEPVLAREMTAGSWSLAQSNGRAIR
jgi:hypothetical protein